jgi:hypothetical protein
MTETSTPDPAQNKPSQAEGAPEDLPGAPAQDKPTEPEEGAGI